MPTYSKPQITITQGPSKFSPVYAPNWYAFTYSTANTTATDINLIYDVQILRQNLETPTLSATAGRFKAPPRENQVLVADPSQALKSYVTFPYNTGDKIYYGDGEAMYVNEVAGFGSQWYSGAPTSSFPTMSPEQDGVVKYRIKYGLEFNPNLRFTTVTAVGAIGPDGIYRDYTRYTCGTVSNVFCDIGDRINIQVDSNLYSYYNGPATVIQCYFFSGLMYVETWQQFNATLGAITTNVSGIINNCQKIYGTSSTYIGYNGTRQYDEKDVNMDNKYYFRLTPSTTPLFPSTSTASNFRFMSDYGYDSNHCIPIRPGQSERVRFLADLYADTNRLLNWTLVTYNQSNTIIGTATGTLNDSPGGQRYPYKCFTTQVFGASSSIAGTSVVDGYKYKFSIRGVSLSADYASIWFKGINPCSPYENVRIKFLNRQGSWQYWNFWRDKKKTTTVNRTEYRSTMQYDQTFQTISKGGTVARTTSPFTLSKLRGQNILSISSNDIFLLNSDWITEDEYGFLEQLVTSPQVYIFHETYTLSDNTILRGVNIPIIITDTSYEHKTTLRDRLFNLQLNYKLAYDGNLQNL